MRSVFKYSIQKIDRQMVRLPVGSKLLRAGAQGDEWMLWALVPTAQNSQLEERFIRIAGTGHPISEGDIEYLNTFSDLGGMLVFHAFEVVDGWGSL